MTRVITGMILYSFFLFFTQEPKAVDIDLAPLEVVALHNEYADKIAISVRLWGTAEGLNDRQRFIVDHYRHAEQVSKCVGIPLPIVLAQASLESNFGKSKLYRETGNLFGIKCFGKSCAPGHCSVYNDDAPTDRFRVYDNPAACFEHYGQFLSRNRYASLFVSSSPYAWAYGLKRCGYATDKAYPRKLLSIIRKYKLG